MTTAVSQLHNSILIVQEALRDFLPNLAQGRPIPRNYGDGDIEGIDPEPLLEVFERVEELTGLPAELAVPVMLFPIAIGLTSMMVYVEHKFVADHPTGVIEVTHPSMQHENSVLRMRRTVNDNIDSGVATLRFELAELTQEEAKETAYEVITENTRTIQDQYESLDIDQYRFVVTHSTLEPDWYIHMPESVLDQLSREPHASREMLISMLDDDIEADAWTQRSTPPESQEEGEKQHSPTWEVDG